MHPSLPAVPPRLEEMVLLLSQPRALPSGRYHLEGLSLQLSLICLLTPELGWRRKHSVLVEQVHEGAAGPCRFSGSQFPPLSERVWSTQSLR